MLVIHTLTNPTVSDATGALTRRLSSPSTFGFAVRGVHHAEATLNLLQSTPPVSLNHVQKNPKAALDLRSASQVSLIVALKPQH